MSTDIVYDVAIVGGGPAGATLACLLGRAHMSVACIDRESAELPPNADLRTTAISYGSRRVLEKAGLWEETLAKEACPIRDIQILDADSPLLLRFLSEEVDGESFGWIVENAHLRTAALAEIKKNQSVIHLPGTAVTDYKMHEGSVTIELNSGQALRARLVVGADGRGSFTRNWMNVGERSWSYNQRAVICTVIHENAHENKAIEHFWPFGPFAILPMNDDSDGCHRSSLVFTEHGPARDSLMRYDKKSFAMAVQARFPSFYGQVKISTPRRCYPLGFIHAHHYTAPRMALVADAAHGIHPIAGQGLNLGYRDVDALAALLIEAHEKGQDPGAQDLLERYQRTRRFDNMSMAAVTDGLVRLFSNNIPPVRFLRRAGLRAVSKLPPVKKFFMRRAMGGQ